MKLWKQTLRYRALWEMKKRPHWPVRKAFARRMRIFFPRVRTKRNQFKHLVVSSRQQLTRLHCLQCKFAYHHVAMGEILIVCTVFCTKLSPKQRLNREKSNLKSTIWPIAMFIIFPRDYSSCFFGYRGTDVIIVYHRNGKYLANSWSSAWRALESAHKFYSIRFYIDVSTFELSLIRF